jgi:hypothetical protein
MTKPLKIIVLLVLLVLVIFLYIDSMGSSDGEPSIVLQDIDVGNGYIKGSINDEQNYRLLAYVQYPENEGSRYAEGKFISISYEEEGAYTDISGDLLIVNVINYLVDDSGRYLAFDNAVPISACLIESNVSIIDTFNSANSIVLEFEEVQDKQEEEYTLTREIKSWEDSALNIREFASSCSSGEILDERVWQYNVQTEEYTLEVIN